MQYIVTTDDKKIDKAKQAQGIIPNIIHSLDASHIMNLIKTASIDKFRPIITVHDCFGTLPSLMGDLEYRVKKEFILLYSKNQFLNDFHQRLIQNLKDNQLEIVTKNDKSYVIFKNNLLEIPEPPKLGDLDLDNIKKSKYMIC